MPLCQTPRCFSQRTQAVAGSIHARGLLLGRCVFSTLDVIPSSVLDMPRSHLASSPGAPSRHRIQSNASGGRIVAAGRYKPRSSKGDLPPSGLSRRSCPYGPRPQPSAMWCLGLQVLSDIAPSPKSKACICHTPAAGLLSSRAYRSVIVYRGSTV